MSLKNFSKVAVLFSSLSAYFLIFANIALSALFTFSFSDPIGDSYYPAGSSVQEAPDLLHMQFIFDNETGNYTGVLISDSTSPFIGNFLIESVFYNPDASGGCYYPGHFFHLADYYSLNETATAISFTGNNPWLQDWNAGDFVSSNQDAIRTYNSQGHSISYYIAVSAAPYEWPERAIDGINPQIKNIDPLQKIYKQNDLPDNEAHIWDLIMGVGTLAEELYIGGVYGVGMVTSVAILPQWMIEFASNAAANGIGIYTTGSNVVMYSGPSDATPVPEQATIFLLKQGSYGLRGWVVSDLKVGRM